MPGTVLVVEDDLDIVALLRDFLDDAGFGVVVAGDADGALDALARESVDCALVDVMLPGTSGFELCRRVRAQDEHLPLLFLSARGDDSDKLRGLGLGADDYIVKSATPAEVVARVKAVLRRVPGTKRRDDHTLRFGALAVDLAAHEVRHGGRAVPVTAREFELLAFLVRNRGIVFSRDRLLERVWGYERPVDTRTVDSHVKSVRQKLGEGGSIIKTLRGVGYKADA